LIQQLQSAAVIKTILDTDYLMLNRHYIIVHTSSIQHLFS